MFPNNDIEKYLDIFAKENSEYIENIRKEALEENVPIIKRTTESFIKFILSTRNFSNILEVGTAVGYSALIMASVSEADIITIEKFDERILVAKENFSNSIYADRIKLYTDDATDILKTFVKEGKKFDFIFMDAAKAQYINWLPFIKSLLDYKGILLSDNILQEGTLINSRYLIERRDRTIHKRLKEYIKELTKDEDFVTTILNVGDGLALSVLNRRIDE